MKVTFFNRPKVVGTFSIETVFMLVRKAFPANVIIKDYYCSPRWNRLYSLTEAYKNQGQVNHITGDVQFLAWNLKGKITILTVHDVGHYERTLKGIKRLLFKWIWFSVPLKKVAAITTISSFTKQKLVQHFNVSESKITVIFNPAPLDFPFSPKPFNNELPLVMQIGSGSHKNLIRLIDAVAGLHFKLLLVRNYDAAIEKLLQQKKIPFEWHENLSRNELYECYKASDIVFFASEYEGFGVPILEAQAVGRPVITSTVASMPEVAGDAALLVDPYRVYDIREALLKLKEDANLREVLIRKGFENLKRFSPETIAEQYYSLYKKIAKL